MSEFNKLKEREDSLKSEVERLGFINDSICTQNKLKDNTIDSLKVELQEIKTTTLQENRILSNLRDSIVNQKRQINQFKKDAASLDMVRLRYANGRLQLPYDRKKIQEAIELFNGITNIDMKEQCQEVLTWLNQYDYYLKNVNSLMISLQENPDRTDKFKFDDWKNSALREINSNEYYMCSRGHQFSILYLDEILDTAKKRIMKSGIKPTVDFSDLLERLDLE